MADESLAVQLARLDERFNTVLQFIEKSERERSQTHEAMDALRLAFQDMAGRVENVEKKLASTEPTITEFVTIKNKVIGAGALGKWLWMLLGAVLSALITGKVSLSHLFKWS